MLQFLNPIALVALAGLIIPVVIHLWNIHQGKTLKVGSIALLKDSSKQSSRRIKVTDWLLLMLRVAFILILGLLLAKPVWQQRSTITFPEGWLLVDQADLLQAEKLYGPQMDSLQAVGYEVHALEPCFPLLETKNSLSDNQVNQTKSHTLSTWTLLAGLPTVIPDSIPVYLIGPLSVSHFQGQRPALDNALIWWTLPAQDTSRDMMVAAYQTLQDSIRVSSVQSTPAQNAIIQSDFLPNEKNAVYQVNFQQGEPTVTSTKSQDSRNLDTLTFQVSIVGNQSVDEGFITAACNAAARYLDKPIRVSHAATPEGLPEDQNLIFWLQPDSVPASVSDKLTRHGVVFAYANGKTGTYHAPIIFNPDQGIYGVHHIYKKTITSELSAEIVWKDGYGQPLLIKDSIHHHTRLLFYSQLKPDWTDLVWSPALAEWMLQLLLPDTLSLPPDFDQRQLSLIQGQPSQSGKFPVELDNLEVEETPLEHILWLLGIVTLALERLLSYQKTKRKKYA